MATEKIWGKFKGRAFLVGELVGDVLYRHVKPMYSPELSAVLDYHGAVAALHKGAVWFGAVMASGREYKCELRKLIEEGTPIDNGNGKQIRFPISQMELVGGLNSALQEKVKEPSPQLELFA